MLEEEINNHLSYEKQRHSSGKNYRNGEKSRIARNKYGGFEVDVSKDRKSTFAPIIAPKRQKDISGIEVKISQCTQKE